MQKKNARLETFYLTQVKGGGFNRGLGTHKFSFFHEEKRALSALALLLERGVENEICVTLLRAGGAFT